MNTLFAEEVYIRLTDDAAGFVCTVKRGQFYVEVTKFALDGQLLTSATDEKSLVLARKRTSHRAASEKQ
jgi:hypothetical protein